ncbi:MAG: rhodanese-like domain-containing protein [Leptospiraceae bacterium]|nr:rhodanese-like domain-containing protein [Leptospiraceae bacterium]
MYTLEIQPQTKMSEILQNYPSARRVLFQKYHIGGCNSCGYSLNDTIEKVFIKHNKLPYLQEAIQLIYDSVKLERSFQIAPKELSHLLEEEKDWILLDVRDAMEREIANISGSLWLTQELAWEILQKWNKQTKMVFFCHTGIRSLEATYFFYFKGFPNVKNLDGGIKRWAEEVDPSIPIY